MSSSGGWRALELGIDLDETAEERTTRIATDYAAFRHDVRARSGTTSGRESLPLPSRRRAPRVPPIGATAALL
jgi:hypothetical protein